MNSFSCRADGWCSLQSSLPSRTYFPSLIKLLGILICPLVQLDCHDRLLRSAVRAAIGHAYPITGWWSPTHRGRSNPASCLHGRSDWSKPPRRPTAGENPNRGCGQEEMTVTRARERLDMRDEM